MFEYWWFVLMWWTALTVGLIVGDWDVDPDADRAGNHIEKIGIERLGREAQMSPLMLGRAGVSE